MAKSPKKRNVVDVSKEPAAGRYRTEKVGEERALHPKAGDMFGPAVAAVKAKAKVEMAAGPKGKRNLPAAPAAKEKPKKDISKRVSVFTPGSKEARASMGTSAVTFARSEAKEGSTKPTPILLKGQERGLSTSSLPKDWNLSEGVFAGTKGAPTGKNDPMLLDATIKNPKSGTFAGIGAERAKHVDTFLRSQGRGPKAEAARQAYHALSSKAPTGAGEEGICSTAGCTRTTPGKGGSCEGGSCNVVDSPTNVQPRSRG